LAEGLHQSGGDRVAPRLLSPTVLGEDRDHDRRLPLADLGVELADPALQTPASVLENEGRLRVRGVDRAHEFAAPRFRNRGRVRAPPCRTRFYGLSVDR